jgi:two-component system, OmpR family, phosphate regulon response regulator PhoB
MLSPRVMVVEDEEPLCVLLRYNLEAEGYQVETVMRGDEAELRLRETVPDLLVLDWMLPSISGIELCRRLRQRPETERLPIIMLTARGEESDRVRGLATGAAVGRRAGVRLRLRRGPGRHCPGQRVAYTAGTSPGLPP